MKWGIHSVNICYLCYNKAEDLDHLLFQCQFATEVWGKVKGLAEISGQGTNWHQIINDMVNSGNGNNIMSVVRRLLLAASVYDIWKERNGRIFRDVTRSSEDVFKGIMETVKTRLMSLTVRESVAVRRMESLWGITCKRVVS
ncbi:reverse transcriptase domain, Reverse transcriptase zinc-binding domain protein [Artemisia annua]|uniref:Reverse transcriptase domain, Reverse transcriptase zinc-binding domain protein n=1 Tax=Artemisia annua TaxID=35608 RepID=A0A2U1LD33_ARTAN|nr:reverse transcriptase domain, Reverse transcriptase zinc-binding domain protein [Artemisia annua]